MSRQRVAGICVLVLTIAFALAPLVRGNVEFPVRLHHLLHTVILLGAVVAGALFGAQRAASATARALWLVIAVIAPLIAMLLMWPSGYPALAGNPLEHVIEHLGLVVLGFLTAYAGQRFAAGIGWAMGMSLLAMAFLAAWGFGVSPPSQVPGEAASSAASTGTTTVSVAAGNTVHGRAVFASNCAVCHGVNGQGGEGPALKNEGSRKNLQQAVQWIENPAPPMPKLYPETLKQSDVDDVAAYIESL